MANYPLSIITPSGKVFESEVVSATFPGAEGYLGVLAKHMPIVSLIKKGVVSVNTGSEQKFFAVDKGVLEVNPQSQAFLLIGTAIPASNKEDALQKSLSLK